MTNRFREDACKRCGELNCFGGCIPFGFAIDHAKPNGDGTYLVDVMVDPKAADLIRNQKPISVSYEPELKGPKLTNPDDVMKCVSDKVEFKEWYKNKYNEEWFYGIAHELFECWMNARGWEV